MWRGVAEPMTRVWRGTRKSLLACDQLLVILLHSVYANMLRGLFANIILNHELHT
jgi:hypothetical protein